MPQFQRIDNKEKWNGLLDKVLFKTFFHTLEWEGFLEKEFDWLKFKRYLYKDKLLLSAAGYKTSGKEKLISHPFCEYGGPLPLIREIDGREFRKDLFLEFHQQLKISFHPFIPQYFKDFGLKEPDSSRDTYFIENLNQENEEEIFSSFRKTLRHCIRKAEEHNLEIKKCESEKELEDFYNLYIKTIKRHKTIPYPLSFFKYFFQHNVNATNNRVEIILAKFKNRTIAGSVFLFHGKYIHYFLNASDLQYKNKNANYLILWSQIKNYLGKNYKVFDFGGTRRGVALEIFKKGWGAKRYPIFEIKNFSETTLRKSNLRNIFPLLPNFLIKKSIPYLLKYKL